MRSLAPLALLTIAPLSCSCEGDATPGAASAAPLVASSLPRRDQVRAECRDFAVTGRKRPPDYVPHPDPDTFEIIDSEGRGGQMLTPRPPAALTDPLPRAPREDLCRVRAGYFAERPDELLSWLIPRLRPGLRRADVLEYLGPHGRELPNARVVGYLLSPERELRLTFEANGQLRRAHRTMVVQYGRRWR